MFIRSSDPFITYPIVKINDHLSYFPAGIIHTPVKFAIYYYSASDTCTKGNKNNIIIPLRSSEPVLCNCHHICIISDICRQTGFLVDYFCQRNICPVFDTLVRTKTIPDAWSINPLAAVPIQIGFIPSEATDLLISFIAFRSSGIRYSLVWICFSGKDFTDITSPLIFTTAIFIEFRPISIPMAAAWLNMFCRVVIITKVA